ncbi:MAG TPA: competence protein ComEA [Anaerolineae bacterium]|nr:competence protein ComEA [Anaerolineae bacterium]
MAGWLERYRGYILIVLLNLVVLGGMFFFLRRPEPEPISILPPEPTATPLPTPTPRPLRVYVSGAVAHPDVYELPSDSIVKDAIEAAGGPTGEADLNRINLARRVYDEEQIYVPQEGEESLPVSPPSSPPLLSPSSRGGGKVNINTATAEELGTLPGIGPTKAQSIIDYRTANGPFQSIEDIKNVRGIGDATFEKLKDKISVQ